MCNKYPLKAQLVRFGVPEDPPGIHLLATWLDVQLKISLWLEFWVENRDYNAWLDWSFHFGSQQQQHTWFNRIYKWGWGILNTGIDWNILQWGQQQQQQLLWYNGTAIGDCSLWLDWGIHRGSQQQVLFDRNYNKISSHGLTNVLSWGIHNESEILFNQNDKRY